MKTGTVPRPRLEPANAPTAFLSLCLRAFAFALVMVAPYLIEYLRAGIYSPLSLSDWDEPFYLPMAYDSAHIPLGSLVRLHDGTLLAYSFLKSNVPHGALDIVAGHVALFLHLRPVQFALLLDIICCVASYLVFSKLLQRFSVYRGGGEIATCLLLYFPWLMSLSVYFPLHFSSAPYLTTSSHNLFPSQPSLRAIYTQISYPLFALGILWTTKALRDNSGALLRYVIVGVWTGFLLYVYFFAWGALLAIVSILLVTNYLFRQKRHLSLEKFSWRFLTFLCCSFCVAALGLMALLPGGRLFTPGPSPGKHASRILHYSQYWFFSPIMFLVLLLFLWLIFRSRRDSPSDGSSRYFLALIGFSCVVAEFLLMNLQPLVNRWLTPYHFPLFYLHPLLTGVTFLLLFNTISRSDIRRLVAVAVVAAACALSSLKAGQLISVGRSQEDLIQLLGFLDTEVPPAASVAVIPYAHAFENSKRPVEYLVLPYWIKTLTHIKVLSEFMSFSEDREALVRKELFLGWLYSGRISLLGPCPDGLQDIPMSDIMTGATAFHQSQRLVDCSLAPRIASLLTPCLMLQSYAVDYIVWDNGAKRPKPIWYGDLCSQIWESPNREFSIWAFDQKKAAQYFCSPVANP